MDALALQIEAQLDELVGAKIPRKNFLSTLMRMCWKKIMLYTVMKDI